MWAFLFIDMEGLKSFQRLVVRHCYLEFWNAWALLFIDMQGINSFQRLVAGHC